MKLKNTNLTWTALLFSAFGQLCDVSNLVHVAATQSPAYVRGYCGATIFMAIATYLGLIQLASLRKQAQELSASVKAQR